MPNVTSDATEASPEPKGTSPGLRALGILMLFVVALIAFPRFFRGTPGPLAGKKAPDFSLETLLPAAGETEATKVSLASLAGQVVILDFWASWCGPCRAQTPIMQEVSRRYEGQGVAVIGVNTQDEPAAARATLAKHRVTYTNVVDAADRTSRDYGIERLPTLIVIGRDGQVVAVRSGLTSPTDLDKILRRAL